MNYEKAYNEAMNRVERFFIIHNAGAGGSSPLIATIKLKAYSRF